MQEVRRLITDPQTPVIKRLGAIQRMTEVLQQTDIAVREAQSHHDRMKRLVDRKQHVRCDQSYRQETGI